jgi:glycosyltransferase involved in cell wall biosynthesis
MNILHTESSLNWGGQEYRTILEHNYLNDTNHSSWLLCDKKSKTIKKSQEFNCKNVLTADLSKSINITESSRILWLCKKHKIDIINSHSPKDSMLCILAFLAGIPLVRSRQITSPIKKRFSYEYLCTHIIATAGAIKNNLISIGVTEKKVTIIGEGVDLSEYTPDNNSDYLKKEFNIQDDDHIVVNIGMIREDKGQEFYLESAKKVLDKNNNVKFFLIGESTSNTLLEDKLKKQIVDYGLSDKFFMTGYRNDVPAFIHLSDLIVIASIAVEAQSRIVPQAFATKRAVVSTNIGGLTELVEDGITGLVVPPKDSLSMSDSILRILSNTELRNQLAANAYQKAMADLSFKKMMENTILLYTKLLK